MFYKVFRNFMIYCAADRYGCQRRKLSFYGKNDILSQIMTEFLGVDTNEKL